jgi:Ankyrin repeats (3 copies)
MINALQMLGYQNSGQWQDARSVAMHILGNQNQGMGGMSGTDDLSNMDLSAMLGGPYNFATATSGENSAPRASSQTSRESKKIEDVVLRVLRSAQHPVTGVISQISTPHPVTGQTLLHLASALGLSKLVWALIGWKANVLIPDKNGFSPVHFACFYGRTECVEILVRVGRAHLEGCDVTGRTPLDVCGTDEVRELVLDLEEEVETKQRRSRIGSEVESGGEGDDEGLSWSEADDDEDEDPEPTKVFGAQAPQPVSRRISRVNSMVSIASHKGISRAGTPYLVDDILAPMTPMHPNPAKTLVPPSPASSWALARNISMPWSAGWQLPQLPNVPAMPQFVQRRGNGRQQKHRDDDSQEEKEQMFRWMMWMDTARKMWQAQQQQQQTTGDIDPPPSYSPTGATSVSGPLCEKGAVATPAAPTALDEPPSPLSLDSPYSAGAAIANPPDPHGHHLSRQRQPPYQRQVADPANDVSSVSAPSSTPTVVVKRKTKTRDTMLIYFWIPVLLCEFRPFS